MDTQYKTISFIIPTIGRPSLNRTIASIGAWPNDEVLVIQHNPPSGDYGNSERQEGIDKAKSDYLAFIDDDDVYVPNARSIMDKAIRENHNGYPILFKMQYPDGRVLWKKKWVHNGNVGTPMILVPNVKVNLHKWVKNRSMADFHFINKWTWHAKDIQWRDEVITLLGHNDIKYEKKLDFQEWRNEIYG